MSFSIQELRAIGRAAGQDDEAAESERLVLVGAISLQWAGVAVFVAMTAATLVVAYYLSTAHELGALRWKILAIPITACLALGYALFNARSEPPDGVRLERDDAPRLWGLVDRISESAGATAPTAIVLTDELNAAAATVPKRGITPQSDTVLVLGLPLLLATSPRQATAIIAHEIGHFSKKHARAGRELHKALIMAAAVTAHAEQTGNLVLRIIARFYDAAGAWLAHVGLGMSRAQEFQADRIAGQIAGRKEAADALIVLHLADTIVGRAPCSLADERTALEQGRPEQECEAALALALAAPDRRDSTHPSLRARIEALGGDMRLPPPTGTEHAAGAWLPNLDALVAQFDAIRSRALAGHDKAVETARSAATERLEAAKATPPQSDEDVDGCGIVAAYRAVARAHDATLLGDLDLAERFVAQARSLAPDDPATTEAVGWMLTLRGDSAGLQFLFDAVQQDPMRAYTALSAAAKFVEENPTIPDALAWRARIEERSVTVEPAITERERAPALTERFLAADLAPTAWRSILDVLESDRNVISATIVRRATKLYPDRPAFVLAIRLRAGWNGSTPDEERAANERIARLHAVVGCYGSVSAIYPSQWNEHIIAWRMRRTPGAQFYYRTQP